MSWKLDGSWNNVVCHKKFENPNDVIQMSDGYFQGYSTSIFLLYNDYFDEKCWALVSKRWFGNYSIGCTNYRLQTSSWDNIHLSVPFYLDWRVYVNFFQRLYQLLKISFLIELHNIISSWIQSGKNEEQLRVFCLLVYQTF